MHLHNQTYLISQYNGRACNPADNPADIGSRILIGFDVGNISDNFLHAWVLFAYQNPCSMCTSP